MQRITIKNLTVALACILPFLFSSCAKDLLTMSVTEPAPVSLPSNIKKVGVLDRSKPSKKTEKFDKIDKILSVEGKNLDKDGAKNAVNGLSDELLKNNRFTSVKTLDASKVDNPGLGVFPAPMNWQDIEHMCANNDVDAIFTLSFYDTDAHVDYKTNKVEVGKAFGVDIPAVEHVATITTLIKTGWRIYDPNSKHILDEYFMNEQVVSSGRGINPVKAVEAIIERKEAVMEVSNDLGYTYALRIVPYRVRVRREYYVKGTDNFKIAKRRAQTGDWDGAAELWEKELDNPKRKVAGRAHYNMAIYNEINGHLDKAIELASKAYTDYKNKEALDYLKVLKYRKRRNAELKNQQEQAQ
jgi:tetratricopeptide (TPR) repeat protein